MNHLSFFLNCGIHILIFNNCGKYNNLIILYLIILRSMSVAFIKSSLLI